MLVLVHEEDNRICESNRVLTREVSDVRCDLVCIHGKHFVPVLFSDDWVIENVKDFGTELGPLSDAKAAKPGDPSSI